MITSLAEIKKRLITAGIVQTNEFLECTASQIEEIMQSQNVNNLPKIYLDFLRVMGGGAGRYLSRNNEFYYPKLLNNREKALEELYTEQSPLQIPADAFVFFTHNQGYQFFFFQTNGNVSDPEYFEYLDGRTAFIHHDSLLGFYERALLWQEEKFDR